VFVGKGINCKGGGRSVVFFKFDHFSVSFKVFGDAFEEVQFLHCFIEFGHLLVDLVVQVFLLSHGFSTFWQYYVLEGVCHCLLAAQRPIRHRGERRRLRERKNSDGLLGVAFNLNLPSTLCHETYDIILL